MSLKIQNRDVNNIYTFDQEVQSIYSGSDLIYSKLFPLTLGAIHYFDHLLSNITFETGDYINGITDLSGNGYHSTQTDLTEQPKYLASNPNIADKIFDFSENDERMMNIPNMGFIVQDVMTFGGWVAPTNNITIKTEKTSGTDGLSGQAYAINASNSGSVGSDYCGCGISIGINRVQVCEHGSGYLPIVLSVSANITSATWHHYMVVYNNGAPDLYFDGAYIKTGLIGIKPNKLPPRGFGANESYGNFAGDIAIYYCFPTALSPQNILDLYNNEKSRFGY
jgi:hypothetical protein